MDKFTQELDLVKSLLKSLYSKTENSIERYDLREKVLAIVEEVRNTHKIREEQKPEPVVSVNVENKYQDLINNFKTIAVECHGFKSDHLEKFNITDDTKINFICDEIGFDSLDKIETIMELENSYDCEIPDYVVESPSTTVRDLGLHLEQNGSTYPNKV